MGADYYVYTEIKRDNKWYALNGKYYNEHTNTYEIGPTYTNGSRTYFSNTHNKLKEDGYVITSSELSDDVLAAEDWFADDSDRAVAISLSDMRNALPKSNRHEYCGYVYKQDIYDYENKGDDIYEWLPPEEYMALPEDVKKAYEFYEWSDPAGWFVHYKDILAIVNHQVLEYMNVNHLWNEPEDIRIVCLASY